MTSLKTNAGSFGVLDGFKIGDVVLWSKLGSKMVGVISDLYIAETGGRDVAYASVYCLEEQKKYDVLCINLKLLTKNELDEQKN